MCVPRGCPPHLGHAAWLSGSCGRGLHLSAPLCLFPPSAGRTILNLQSGGRERGTDPFFPGVYTTSARAAGSDASTGSQCNSPGHGGSWRCLSLGRGGDGHRALELANLLFPSDPVFPEKTRAHTNNVTKVPIWFLIQTHISFPGKSHRAFLASG